MNPTAEFAGLAAAGCKFRVVSSRHLLELGDEIEGRRDRGPQPTNICPQLQNHEQAFLPKEKVVLVCLSGKLQQIELNRKGTNPERKVKEVILGPTFGFAGHWARVPPDPIPNSEVKPRSVPRCIVVFGHEKPGKLATHLSSLKSNARFG